MANLDLTGQQAYADSMAPKIQSLKNRLDERSIIWEKLSTTKKKKWITSGKDPIMTIAWQMFKYLRNNFFGDIRDA